MRVACDAIATNKTAKNRKETKNNVKPEMCRDNKTRESWKVDRYPKFDLWGKKGIPFIPKPQKGSLVDQMGNLPTAKDEL